MRIRTDGKFGHRESTIENVQRHYQCNKTKALMLAADQVPQLHDAVADILDRGDLTADQRREIADRFNECRGMDVDVETTTDVTIAE